MLSLQLASNLAALSVASLYRASDDKRLVLRKLYSRTLVVTSSLSLNVSRLKPSSWPEHAADASAYNINLRRLIAADNAAGEPRLNANSRRHVCLVGATMDQRHDGQKVFGVLLDIDQ
jgi:hypothetical protein